MLPMGRRAGNSHASRLLRSWWMMHDHLQIETCIAFLTRAMIKPFSL